MEGQIKDLEFSELNNLNISEDNKVNDFLKIHLRTFLQGLFAKGLITLDSKDKINIAPQNNNIIIE